MSSAPRDRKGILWGRMSNARTKKRFLRHVLAVAQYQPNLAKAKSSTSADVEFASAEMRRAREEAFISGVARLAFERESVWWSNSADRGRRRIQSGTGVERKFIEGDFR